jgi:hypothetical protein
MAFCHPGHFAPVMKARRSMYCTKSILYWNLLSDGFGQLGSAKMMITGSPALLFRNSRSRI